MVEENGNFNNRRLLASVVLPAGLEERVMARIYRAEKRRTSLFLAFWAGVDILSIGALAFCLIYLSGVLAQTGFGQYLSLILSDGNSLALYWQELALSLAESLPVLGLVALFSVCLVLWSSLAKTFTNFRSFLLTA